MLVVLVLLPLQLLSGGVTPRESMPLAVQYLMLLAPTTHFVALGKAILYRGAGLAVVWPALLALVAIAVVLFGVSLLLFRRSVAQAANT
jgi:ABC-2 type transport system permease protein